MDAADLLVHCGLPWCITQSLFDVARFFGTEKTALELLSYSIPFSGIKDALEASIPDLSGVHIAPIVL